MRRASASVAIILSLLLLAPPHLLHAQRSRGSVSRSGGGNASWQSASGRTSGSRTTTQTSSGGSSTRQTQTQSGASRETTRTVDTESQTASRSTTTTTASGESATRERSAEAQGGYASIEGSASTSTGRSAEGQGVAGRTVYGQPAAAGTVNTNSGTYGAAAVRQPGGGYTSAVAGPYGGKVTTTLPSGARATTYHGRSYYTWGGAYHRPYTYHGVHYYYRVPPPYYSYYYQPPVGAIIIVVLGITYLMAQDGSYSTKTTDSQGQTAYQTVPAPQGAAIKTLPEQRVLVTVSGTTYYLYSNAFYRRIVQGTQEQFVVVTAPAGVVFLAAMPPDFEVVQFNTMYFTSGGRYYVSYLASDGKELYVMVDAPPQPQPVTHTPPATAPPTAAAPKPAPPPPATDVRTVVETLTVPTGTLLLVRLQTNVSSESAKLGDRFQAFLDRDLAANGRLILARGAHLYGVVIEVDRGSKALLSVALTDIQAGDKIVPIKTQPVHVSSANAAVIPAQKLQAFTTAVPFQVEVTSTLALK